MIKTGSIVWIDRNSKDVEIGDVIAYQLDKNFMVTHRVIDRTEGGYITKGDANENADFSPVSKDQVIGKFAFSIPCLGFVMAEIQQNRILLLPIVSVALLIILFEKLLSDDTQGD